jgi:hypothetical protein
MSGSTMLFGKEDTMPNWCINAVKIYFDNKNPSQVTFINNLKLAAEENKLLNFLKPMPAHQPDVTKPNAFFATGGLGQDEQNTFGKNNWYDWSIQNWGTKWEVNDASVYTSSDHIVISFDSAWSPPVDAIRILGDKGYDFVHYYFESGMGYYGASSNDSDSTFDVNFKDSARKNEAKLQIALLDMINVHGINPEILDYIDLVGFYYDPDYELDEDEDEEVAGA